MASQASPCADDVDAHRPELPLLTERLVLRPHLPADLDALLSYYGRADVSRYLLTEPWDLATAEEKLAERVLRRHLGGVNAALGLVAVLDGRLIGDIALWATDDSRLLGEIGWAFHPDVAGQGYATEAAAAVLDLALQHYRMHRVVARMDARNTASARVCERLGMTREALLRQDWFSKGEWTDTLVYGVLSSDPRPWSTSPVTDVAPQN